jgi:DNA polymerase III sliding clamp (beta) subunit (PCNA family)
MRLNLKHRLERLASKDETRPALHALYLRITGEGDDRHGYLEGTDSYKLGRIPVDLSEGDVEGFVPLDVLASARTLKCDEIACNGSLELRQHGVTMATYPRENRGQFPNTDQLIAYEPARIEGDRWSIGLNPSFLLDLARAMGAETVELEFTAVRPAQSADGKPADFRPSNLRPITVRPVGMIRGADEPAGMVGVLMPVKVPGA